MTSAAVDRARRALTFARYVPLSKLLRRGELYLRRQLRDRLRFGDGAVIVAPQRAPRPPSPIFAPRSALSPKRVDAGWRFEFLHRAVDMAGPNVDWIAPGPGPTNQLWRMNLHYMEYLEGLDDATWGEFVEDWIASQPAGRPGAWRDSWNSYALSLRVVVWLQELARRHCRVGDTTRRRIEASAAGQLRFLEEN